MDVGDDYLQFGYPGAGFGMDRLSEKRKDLISKEITLLLTIIQGFVLVSSMQLTQPGWEAKGTVLLTLTAGTMLVMWLSNMNALLGIGGLTLLVLANILQAAMKTGLAGIMAIANHSAARLALVVAALIVILVLFAYLNVLADRGEYRLPLVRLLIDNTYASRSYLPIKLTPAGGMPIMFAMSMIMLPTYFCLFMLTFYPQSHWLQWGRRTLALPSCRGLSSTLSFCLPCLWPLLWSTSMRSSKPRPFNDPATTCSACDPVRRLSGGLTTLPSSLGSSGAFITSCLPECQC